MGEKTNIKWCTSTFNPWIGCTKVGPGCDHCYAEVQDSRKRWGDTTHWGVGVARYRTSASNWAQPIAWNKKAAASGKVHRVFCASLADVFDNEVTDKWRDDFYWLIMQTPYLDWLIVTKRIGNVAKMWPSITTNALPNVRILITVCNQEEADRDIPKLLELPCKNGVSYEPALASVDWSRFQPFCRGGTVTQAARGILSGAISWVIIGGESGQKARPFDLAWARSTVAQCKAAGVPVFVKQLGAQAVEWEPGGHIDGGGSRVPLIWKDRAGADPSEWPDSLRVQEFPLR